MTTSTRTTTIHAYAAPVWIVPQVAPTRIDELICVRAVTAPTPDRAATMLDLYMDPELAGPLFVAFATTQARNPDLLVPFTCTGLALPPRPGTDPDAIDARIIIETLTPGHPTT
ncbi:hypothetical protein [Propionibacterium freudenreichii]|uniref:hypothetical protein n=1 Tax=Propionibacterium freudenreichii TaxID=1744 RepID=UPI0021A38A82|nr:hypothetical protein [Propionibacterium freudenreichii]MCT2983789.1 hypothetical protein [Propionibacterium freudenreichii]